MLKKNEEPSNEELDQTIEELENQEPAEIPTDPSSLDEFEDDILKVYYGA